MPTYKDERKRKTKYTNTDKKKVRPAAINERLSNFSPIVIPCIYIHYFSPIKILRKQIKGKKDGKPRFVKIKEL